MSKKFVQNKGEILKYVSATLTASAVLVSTVAPVGAEELSTIKSSNVDENLAGGSAANVTTLDTATISYDRQDAFDAQDNVFPNNNEQTEFIKHVVENNTTVTVTDKDQLSDVVSDAIKNNEAVIVIEDVNDVLSDIALNGDNVITEIKKTGTNAGALVSGYGLTTVLNEQGDPVWVLMPYYEETNALAESKAQYIDQVANYVNSNYSTEIEKLHAIYSFLGETTVYSNNTNTPASSPAALILENQAVCEAFAYLYNEIAEKTGFNMRYVTGVTNNGTGSIGHAWNLVELNGQWYNTDATWGNIDRNGENSLETNMSYFLFSDTKAQTTHKRENNALPSATDTTYDVLYSDTPNYAYGGGITGNLIVSPNTNEIVVFDTTTNQKSGVSIPTSTADYDIFTSALVGTDLFVTYLDYNSSTLKLGKIDVTTGTLTQIHEGFNGYADVKYTKDGIFVAGSLVHQYDSAANVISRDLNVNVTVGNDHDFALQTAYKNFVISHDNTQLQSIDSVYSGFTNNTDAVTLQNSLNPVIAKIKDVTKRQEQESKLVAHVSYLELIDDLTNFTVSTDTATETALLTKANTITDSVLKAQALQLIADRKAELVDAENANNGGSTTPPTTGNGNGGSTTPPTTGNGNGGSTTPPTTGNDNGGSTTPPTTGNDNGGSTTPPTTGNDNGGSVTSPTTGNGNGDTPITETPSIPELVDDINIEGGTVALNENGELVITVNEISNMTATTITLPLEMVNGVLRLKLADGTLKAVPYTIQDNEVIVTLHQGGTLVSVEPTVVLSDIANSIFKEQIQKLTERGIFTGDNGKFNPNADMTRAQFAATLVRALGLNESSSNPFVDVPSDAWYAGSVATLAELGIFKGSEGKFNPGGTITRQQMFAVVGRILESKGITASNADILGNFKDGQAVDDYAKPYVALLIEIGAVNGSNGALNPKGNITRGQMAKVLVKVLERLEMI